MTLRIYSIVALAVLLVSPIHGQSALNIHSATLGESGSKTQEISTDDLRRILTDKTATVFDVRPAMEFATSHIPGAVNVAQKPGTSKALYVSDVAEIMRLLGGDKSKPIVLYCNGPFCGKSKRVSDELLAAGFTNVKRYQLGIPVWRALGGITQIEPDGVRYVMQNDHTAVWLDTRSADDIAKTPLAGAKQIGVEVTRGGKDNPAMQQAKNDGTLPVEDHNTRIIVIGDDPQVVLSVTDAIAKEAFHNVAFFTGKPRDLTRAVSGAD
jgi:rhodanese-related sulfurtransferase